MAAATSSMHSAMLAAASHQASRCAPRNGASSACAGLTRATIHCGSGMPAMLTMCWASSWVAPRPATGWACSSQRA